MKYALGLFKNWYSFRRRVVNEYYEDNYYSYLIADAKRKAKEGYYQGILLKEGKLYKRVDCDGVTHTYLNKEQIVVIKDLLRSICKEFYLRRKEWVKMYSTANKLVIEINRRKIYVELEEKSRRLILALIYNLRETCDDRGIYYIVFRPSEVIYGGDLIISWHEEEYNCVGVVVRKVVNGKLIR